MESADRFTSTVISDTSSGVRSGLLREICSAAVIGECTDLQEANHLNSTFSISSWGLGAVMRSRSHSLENNR